MAETAYTPRLRAEYDKSIRGKLTEQFGYANVMQVPRLDKVVLNMGIGEAVNDRKKAETAAGDLWISEVREARGGSERLQREGPACVAWLRANPGAAARLLALSQALVAEPGKSVAELRGLGGTPGCATR